MSTELGPKDPAEVVTVGIDLTARLGTSETVSTCAFSVTPVGGLGADSATMTLSGVADITAAPIVRQLVQAGTPGWTYRVKATATTNQGRTVAGSVLLPVVEGA